MAEAEADPVQPTVPDAPVPTRATRSLWLRGMTCVAILPLLGFIGQMGPSLWGEFRSLRRDQVSERESAIVGYVNINPRPSFARRPADWLHDEGDTTLLWAGWIGEKHQWYRVGKGEIDPKRISLPMGKDVIQAIDYPLFEGVGGDRWKKVPDEAPVAGFEERKESTAYPIKVLDKVEVVNDQYNGRPVLVAYTPGDNTVSIYEATLDGNRVTMGHCGYFFGQHPILYDRGTESLWSQQDGALVAIAGRRKGMALDRIALLPVMAWRDWRASHPDGRLLIGADRSKAKPVD